LKDDTPEKKQRYANFPVGLQLVGQRQMEQKLMEIALVMSEIVIR
jgi:Asp-tRNA(Asn)/Glu-tRNA(Gln) amidotransferase A subunit family amidase